MRLSLQLLTILVAGFILLFGKPLAAQDYAGSETCKTCHSNKYDNYTKSGHPYKINKVEGAAPVYPEGTSPGVPNPPEDQTWDDISYVIGGFGWKARFMDSEGYILTGDSIRQYNLANAELGLDAGWSGYDSDKAPRKPYTCGSCHTTGWVADEDPDTDGDLSDNQDGLEGIHGTWVEPGIRCEACHGPSADHAESPSTVKPSTEENCSTCHIRGDVTQIDASGGLIKHHEQYEDLLASPHKNFDCGSCHSPHKSTKYAMGGYKGDDETCLTCHSDVEIKIDGKADFSCKSCHMPFAAKSAVNINIDYEGGTVPKGDIRTHMFRINPDTSWNMFTDDGAFVRVDDEDKAYISLPYACLSCHTNQSLAWAGENANAIHGTGTAIHDDLIAANLPANFELHQNFPNPFNPSTTIVFDLPEASDVNLAIYTIDGKRIQNLINNRMPAGRHNIKIDGSNLASGIYIYSIQAGEFSMAKKMILTK